MLDDAFGLHPNLPKLHAPYRTGELLPIHACATAYRERSHFDAQDYMESGTPGVKSTRDGWLNRYLQVKTNSKSLFRGVAMTQQMPRAKPRNRGQKFPASTTRPTIIYRD